MKNKIDSINKKLGIYEASFIATFVVLIKLSVLTEQNNSIMMAGEGSTGKSFVFSHMNLPTYSEEITSPLLRGKAIGNTTEDNSSCIFEESVVVFEEIAKNFSSEVNSEFKNVMTSKRFNKNKKEETLSPTSFVFNGNSYDSFEKIEDILINSFPKDFSFSLKDSAFLSRISALIPSFHNFLGKINYKEADDLKTFKDGLLQLREFQGHYKFNIDNKFFDSRSIKTIETLSSGIIKVLYSKEEPPQYVVDGIIEFASFFHAIALRKFYDPINKASSRFLIEALHGSIDEVEYVIPLANRVLIKLKNQSLCYKYAINGFGTIENSEEYEYFNSTFNKEIFGKVLDLKNNNTLLIQEFEGMPCTNKIIRFNIENSIFLEPTDDEFNNLLFDYISESNRQPRYNFRGINSVTYNMIKNSINTNLGLRIDYLSKRSITISKEKSSFKLINFHQYIKKK